MTYCSHDDLSPIHRNCAEGDRRWQAEKNRFAEFLVRVAELWPWNTGARSDRLGYTAPVL
jgi:hypothetical protein